MNTKRSTEPNTASRVEGLLERCTDEPLKAAGPARWAVVLRNGHAVDATASLQNNWLRLRTCPLDEPTGPYDLLLHNGALSGGVKVGVPPGESSGRLLAETHLAGTEDDVADVRSICDGLARVHGLLAGERPAPANPLEPSPDGQTLAEQSTRAGWAPRARSNGEVVVPLETPRPRQAELRSDGDHLIARVNLLPDLKDLPDVSRDAACLLVLTVAGCVALVRPVVRSGQLGLECPLPRVGHEELDRTFSALSVGCGLCVREITVLTQEPLAERYLALRLRAASVAAQSIPAR